MRYVVAMAGSVLLIGGAMLYVRQTNRGLEQVIRQGLLKQQQAGTRPAELQGIDLQAADLRQLGDFQMSLPAGLEQRLKLSMYLTDFWYVWVPLIVIICFGSAALVGLVTKREK